MPNKRALIVDDSSTAQYRLKKMLRAYSLDIDTADSGEAALRYLAHHSPDVIFMDHLMPGMDGFRALQIIKSHPETATIPVIMYTSKSGDLYTGQARALGALDVVSKDTINAADLSKVMEAIHIFRTPPESQTETRTEETEYQATTDVGHDLSEPQIDRRAPHPASLEQARSLELRLSHMELALEDNRRVLTARVARELNGLRHNLKKELSELITHNHPTVEHDETITPVAPAPQSSSILSKFIFLISFITIIVFFVKINTLLSESQQKQEELAQQITTLATLKPLDKPAASTTIPAINLSAPITTKESKGSNYLADLAWAFNQNGQLPFYQNSIEPKKLIHLYELLNRVSRSGFKGDAWINIFIGNFCLALDNYGTAQLPKDNITMNECVFSSEIYGMDRLMEEYTHDAEAALNNLEQTPDKNIRIIINTLSETESYPERKPSLTAKNWNNTAQNHNRIEIRLEPAAPSP